MDRFGRRFFKTFDLSRDEAPTALLMALYFFMVMSCVSIVKSLQNALYLSKVGFDWHLPGLYVILAVLSVPVVLLQRHLAKRFLNVWLNSWTLLFFTLSLGVFWVLLRQEHFWVYFAFYAWGAIFSVLVPTQGWMISYDLYTTRKAKRLFAILGTGGILGGAFGGYYTALAAETLGTTGLLLHVGIFLVGMQLVLWVTYQRNRRRLSRKPSSRHVPATPGLQEGWLETGRKLFQSNYFSYLAALTLLTGLTTTVVDLQYKWSLDQHFSGGEVQITQFFGTLLGTIFVFSLLFQLFATSRILRNLGVGFGLLVLPFALIVGLLGVPVTTAFLAAVVLKMIDGCLRSSVNRTSIELLYVPTPNQDRVTIKSFIDLVVARLGDGLGAAAFLLVSFWFISPLHSIGLIVLIGAVGWALLSLRLGEEYVQTLRRTLEIRPTPAARHAFHFEEAGAEKILVTALSSPNPTKVYFALQQLILMRPEEGHTEDASSRGEEMMETQLSGIFNVQEPEWLKSVAALVDHPDWRVSSAALHLMIRYQPGEYLHRLRKHLSSEQPPAMLYLLYVDRYVEKPGPYLNPSHVLPWSQNSTPEQATILARLMGKTRNPAFLPVLRQWMNGPRGEATRAAIEAIGHYADPQIADDIIAHLPSYWSRLAARKALVAYGDSVVPVLIEKLRDPKVNLTVKREIPLILTQIGSQPCRAGLVASLYLPDSVVSFRALKGLNKIRDVGELSYTQPSFLPVLQMWAKQYYELLNLDLLLEKGKGGAGELLRKTVKERMEWTIEKIFRGLGLFFPFGDAYFSYVGYTSDQEELRENAIELIDSRIKGELRKTLLPIFAETNPGEVARKGRRLFGLSSGLDTILSELLFEGDPWLKCCVIAATAALHLDSLKDRIRQACEDVNPMVRETAHQALALWGGNPVFGR